MSTRLRRKALQDFYQLQNPSQESVPEKGVSSEFSGDIPVDFEDDQQVEVYVTKSNIEDILALRNAHTDKLNLFKLTKKSIIYDNYSELINLSNVLKEFESVNANKEDDIDALLDDLVDFSKNKVSEFNVDFKELLMVDDESSVKGTVDMQLEDDGVQKPQLMAEITRLLTAKKLAPEEITVIENIIPLLDNPEGKLLRQQLMEVKRK